MSYNARRKALLDRAEGARHVRHALDRRAASRIDPDAYWGGVVERLEVANAPRREEEEMRSYDAFKGRGSMHQMLEEDELMRKVARGAAPPPPAAGGLPPLPIPERSLDAFKGRGSMHQMLEEDELMRKVARGAAPPPPAAGRD